MDADFSVEPFETGVLGVPVGKLSVAEAAEQEALDDLVRQAAGWREQGVWLVSCRVGEASPVAGALEAAGFRCIETLVTLEHRLDGAMPTDGAEIATAADRGACLEIARRAFTNDRLHSDPQVPDAIADRVRRAWIENDLGGRTDANFVVRDDGAVAGFSLCLFDGDVAVIDLIAVDAGKRNRGLGGRLVGSALAHYQGRVSSMRVGTQADNLPSLALYRRTGFAELGRHETFHWVNPDAAPASVEEEA